MRTRRQQSEFIQNMKDRENKPPSEVPNSRVLATFDVIYLVLSKKKSMSAILGKLWRGENNIFMVYMYIL